MVGARPCLRQVSYFVQVALVIIGLGLHAGVVRAQVVTSITATRGVGDLGTQVNPAGNVYNITGGTASGVNLFHSFGRFNLGNNETANFCNVAACGAAVPSLSGIQNILGRVTGGQTSNIFGTIQTTNFGAANLFLINTAGWIFGSTAGLNVGGAFHVSTADYVRFPDVGGAQVKFAADASPLPANGISVDPIAFGFLSPNPTRISLQGSSLQVPNGKTLALVGGAAAFSGQGETGLNISGPLTLAAPGGEIRIVSVASASAALPREVPVMGDLKVGSPDGLGTISISNQALLTVSSNAAGSVMIRGGKLVIDGQNTAILADTGSADAAATAVDIEAKSVSLTDGVVIRTLSAGSGRAGNVQLAVGESVEISGGTLNGPSRIISEARSSGDGGQVIITSASPSPSLSLSNHGRISSTTFFGTGRGGDIVAEVKDLSITGGGEILSAANGSFGRGGDIKVTATGSVTLSDEGSRIFSRSFPNVAAGGGAGDISLDVTGNLTLQNRAQIQSGDVTLQGANIALKAGDSISISGESGISSQAFSQDVGQVSITTPSLTIDNGFVRASTRGAGNAGTVLVDVGTVTLSQGAQIASSSEFSATTGRGGDVRINAGGPVSISGTGSGLFSTAEGIGDAGTIEVTAPTLNMIDGSKISVATEGTGRAGDIALSLGNFMLTSGARVDSSTSTSGQGGNLTLNVGNSTSISGNGNPSTGLFSTASSTGKAGEIIITTSALSMTDGGTISVATSATGDAGSALLNVNNFTLTGGSQITSSTSGSGAGGTLGIAASDSGTISGTGSGLFSTASSTGNAGEITVNTPTLTMNNGSAISVATSGAGNAGSTSLNVTNFSLTGGARVDSSTSGAGSGGDLDIAAVNSATISDPGSGLFSTASGSGAGGDITLQANNIQLNNSGTISANSTGTETATAGNVNVVFGDTFNMASGGSVTTGAEVADGGNISITVLGSMLQMTDSQITTSVASGVGSGGNIQVGSGDHPLDFIILKDSEIRADAFGGPGGNINIFADVYLTSNSIVSASSALSTPGVIDVQAAFTDVSGSVAQLPEAPLQATELLRAACAARFAGGKASSLVVGGRDGIPIQPGGLLPSPIFTAGDSTGTKTSVNDLPLRFSLLGPARNLTQYTLLPNEKCSF